MTEPVVGQAGRRLAYGVPVMKRVVGAPREWWSGIDQLASMWNLRDRTNFWNRSTVVVQLGYQAMGLPNPARTGG